MATHGEIWQGLAINMAKHDKTGQTIAKHGKIWQNMSNHSKI